MNRKSFLADRLDREYPHRATFFVTHPRFVTTGDLQFFYIPWVSFEYIPAGFLSFFVPQLTTFFVTHGISDATYLIDTEKRPKGVGFPDKNFCHPDGSKKALDACATRANT